MSNVAPEWSDDDGPQPHLTIPTDHIIWDLKYLPDGRVVAHSSNGTVKILNMENGKQEGTTMRHGDTVHEIAVSQDGKKIVSSTAKGSVKIWDVKSHQLVNEWTHHIYRKDPRIAISPDDNLVAVSDYRTVFIRAMEREWQVDQSIEVHGVLCMSFSPGGDKLACGTSYGVLVYDVASGALVLGPLWPSGEMLSLGWIRSVKWSRDGNRLFSSGGKTICCWTSNSGEPIGEPWTGHTKPIRSISLSPDGSVLASASHDQTVRLWDASSGNPIGQPLRHKKCVPAIHFSPCGQFVASAGSSRKILVWKVPRLNIVESRVNVPQICRSTPTHHSLLSHRHTRRSLV